MTYLIGIGGIVSLMVGWVLIQTIWKKVFSDYLTDDDSLAERSACGNCSCTTACKNKRKALPQHG